MADTGYKVKIEEISVTDDITAAMTAVFILYSADEEEIFRERTSIPKLVDDRALKSRIDRWADSYISSWEQNVALQTLASESSITGIILDHDDGVEEQQL